MLGISARQGPHQVAQKFTRTTWPRSALRSKSRPSAFVILRGGARYPLIGSAASGCRKATRVARTAAERTFQPFGILLRIVLTSTVKSVPRDHLEERRRNQLINGYFDVAVEFKVSLFASSITFVKATPGAMSRRSYPVSFGKAPDPLSG